MIFATVGTQLPFDRMLVSLNRWAARNPHIPVFAQIGDSCLDFPFLETKKQLSQAEFQSKLRQARVIVAHAGMGTILSAAELGTPLILMPRRLKYNEHRSDHQMDTAAEMSRLSNLVVVEDGPTLGRRLDDILNDRLPTGRSMPNSEPADLDQLLTTIQEFVWANESPPPAKPTATKRMVK